MKLVRALVPLVAALPLLLARLWSPTACREGETGPAPAPPARSRPRVPRPRPYVPVPAATLTQERAADFARVAQRHAPLWALAYDPVQTVVFTARHRVLADLVVGSSDLDALDFALTEFTPPGYARAYLTRAEQARTGAGV
ncbi:hypothetical protein NI17_020650 [Thermobifida halotolerans]|uniref:Uncharacterized protein n=1 Tax=Thermobifida halotolerans TaxID=483545 RepID=A0A399G2H3_9ACTN|nr:hypothetical protein [Thermobifida halotolerans]UOE19138.1 hypothetical protein NI17_020650 [Thermobifida halotolerans]